MFAQWTIDGVQHQFNKNWLSRQNIVLFQKKFKRKYYILTRVNLLYPLCCEIPCRDFSFESFEVLNPFKITRQITSCQNRLASKYQKSFRKEWTKILTSTTKLFLKFTEIVSKASTKLFMKLSLKLPKKLSLIFPMKFSLISSMKLSLMYSMKLSLN